MSVRKTIKVFAPASVANVAVGYDILGFPLCGIGDDIIFRSSNTAGLKIKTIHKGRSLPKDTMKNTASFAAFRLLKSLGMENEGIEMEIFKNMAVGTGLGSSAASAVAGAFGVNAFIGEPYSKAQILKFATEAEELADGSYHADNVAPSLLGSFILIRDNKTLDWTKLPVPIGLRTVIVRPKISVLTKDSRSILSNELSLEKHIAQSANLASFVASLYKTDFELMKRSLKDLIIEPQRASLIPEFYDIQNIALEHGALGCSISGAGPSIFALCNNSLIAENILESWTRHYKDKEIDCDCFISDINKEGAKVY